MTLLQVLVAILPQNQMQYFDVQTKTWKALPSMAQLSEATECFAAEYAGNYLYVASKKGNQFINYRYHIVSNTWETLPPFVGLANQINCLCYIEDHIYAIYYSVAPYRYSIGTNKWQCVSKSGAICNMPSTTFCNKAAVVFKSCVYVLYGQGENVYNCLGYPEWKPRVAVMHCFDPKRNMWEQKATTKGYHFGSSLFVVNNRLYVAGGQCSVNYNSRAPCGGKASVEVYDDQNDSWSVVDQPHIPPNNLGAVEVEGRVYFIVKNLPLDLGIRIPPGEVYAVSLDEWENLGKVDKNAVLCCMPVKRENLTAE